MSETKLVKSVVWITDQFVGFHRWPNAPEEVAFLRDLHRHIFKVQVRIDVTTHDREVEFFYAKKLLGFAINHMRLVLTTNQSLSCEQMAILLHKELAVDFKVASVEVSEDGENGATLYFA